MLAHSLLLVGLSMLAAACNPEGRGFRLPDGSVDAGRATFTAMGCHDCHSLAGIEHNAGAETGLDVPLGGDVTRVKTYGELVTSIINPSHKIRRPYPPQAVAAGDESMMRSYSSVMTVQQLVDLVTFLETEYDLLVPHSYL